MASRMIDKLAAAGVNMAEPGATSATPAAGDAPADGNSPAGADTANGPPATLDRSTPNVHAGPLEAAERRPGHLTAGHAQLGPGVRAAAWVASASRRR